ncbi:rRNA adenine N(6)-methyltransferase family protein [Candidatus Saccharibacteria bacterium]|nr:rRNA adenine N(6)-methyltransferase family protein [Candidatus Saccharibacteria bacterium]
MPTIDDIMSTMKRRADYSQNFLRSPRLVAGLLDASDLRKDDTVYDIGAGSGIITSELAKRVGKVVAIEYDSGALATLKRNAGQPENVEIKAEDILTTTFLSSAYKVVANIPFHLSSAIVQKLIQAPVRPTTMHLITQKQFAEKLLSQDARRFTSQLGMLVGVDYTARIVKRLKKTDFWPHPAVDTVYVELKQRKHSLIADDRREAYRRFTEECFSDPKKLAQLPLERIGAKPGLSPSRLTLERWLLLFHSQNRY